MGSDNNKAPQKRLLIKEYRRENDIHAIPTVDHYGQLPNLQNALEQDAALQIQDEINTSGTPNSDYQNKNRSIGNINPRRKKQINPSVRGIEIANRFEVLEVDRHLHRNEVRMEITSEKTIGTVNKGQRERMKQNHRATNVKERFPALQNQTEHNLQSQSTIHQPRNIKKN